MKSTLSLVFAAFICSTAFAQTVNHKMVSDDPSDMRKLQVAVDAFMTAGFSLEDNDNDGYLAFGYQIRAAYYPIMNRIGVEFEYQKGSDIGSGLDVSKTELRGSFALISASSKKTRVLTIDQSVRANYTVNTNIRVPQTVQNNLEGRFSLLRNKGFAGQVDFGAAGTGFALYNTTAVGLGLQWRSYRAYEALIDNAYYIKSSGHFQLYGDVLFGMGTSWGDPNSNSATDPTEAEIEAALDAENIRSNVGGRIGFKATTRTTKTLAFSGGAEVGFLPPNSALHSLIYFGMTLNFL